MSLDICIFHINFQGDTSTIRTYIITTILILNYPAKGPSRSIWSKILASRVSKTLHPRHALCTSMACHLFQSKETSWSKIYKNIFPNLTYQFVSTTWEAMEETKAKILLLEFSNPSNYVTLSIFRPNFTFSQTKKTIQAVYLMGTINGSHYDFEDAQWSLPKNSVKLNSNKIFGPWLCILFDRESGHWNYFQKVKNAANFL